MGSIVLSHDVLAAYIGNKADLGLRDNVVEMAVPLVRIVAVRLVTKRNAWIPTHVDEDELFSEGLARLTDVVDIFAPSDYCEDLPRAFVCHVMTRTRWHLLDFVRKERDISRSSLDHALRFKAAFASLVSETGYTPALIEIADRLGVSLEIADVWRISAMELDVYFSSIDFVVQSQNSSFKGRPASVGDLIAAPYRKTLEEQDLDFDALLPSSLTALERAIITALFRDNKTMLEIGSAFGFSESRISQIFADVMPRIRVSYFARFRKDGEDSDG